MKKINDDSNNNNDCTNTNDPFTGFTIHGYKNSRPNFQKTNKSKIKKAFRMIILFFYLFISIYLEFGSFRKDSRYQDYKQYFPFAMVYGRILSDRAPMDFVPMVS
jgi:hypothetical protein